MPKASVPYSAKPPQAQPIDPQAVLAAKLDAVRIELIELRRVVALGAYAQVAALKHLDMDLTRAAEGRRDGTLSLEASWKGMLEQLAKEIADVSKELSA